VQLWRHVLDQKADSLIDRVSVDQVVVVEHQHQAGRRRSGQLIQ